MNKKRRLKEIKKVRRLRDKCLKINNIGRLKRFVIEFPDVISYEIRSSIPTSSATLKYITGHEYYIGHDDRHDDVDSIYRKCGLTAYKVWREKILSGEYPDYID